MNFEEIERLDIGRRFVDEEVLESTTTQKIKERLIAEYMLMVFALHRVA